MSRRAGARSGTAGIPGPAVTAEPGSGAGPAPAPRQEGQGAWPLRSYLELGALPGAVPSARLHARLVLAEWGMPAPADDAQVIVSELMTNALVHAGTPVIRFWLLSDYRHVVIMVWDCSAVPPVPADRAADAPDGRGLAIVAALAERWGWSHARTGKLVWASLAAGRSPADQ